MSPSSLTRAHVSRARQDARAAVGRMFSLLKVKFFVTRSDVWINDAQIATPYILANVNSHSRSLYAIARPSVCRLSSVTFVRPTQAVPIFGNISTALGTLAIG